MAHDSACRLETDCRVAARDDQGVGEAPSKRVLLIVAYDCTDWLALGLLESACGVFLILVKVKPHQM
jgi:hypothetical protein